MHIRPENATDHATIYTLTQTAFEPMPFSDGDEADCINKLRDDGDLTLSLVAVSGDDIVGHIAFSPVFLNGDAGGWIGLGPVSVWPEKQKQGIGAALIDAGLAHFRDKAYAGCILIGDPAYYKRFGFVGDGRITYRDLASEYVQWHGFGDAVPDGVLSFSPGLE